MAVLDKIRQRTGMMLIVVLGATAAFIFTPGAGGGDKKSQVVGEINGEEIDSQEYNNLVDKYVNSQQGRGTRANAENYAWTDMVFEFGWKPQLEKAGVYVTRSLDDDETSEEFDMMQGKTLLKEFYRENQQENLPIGEFIEKFNGIISQIMDAGTDHQSYGMLTGNKENYYNSRLKDKYTSLFVNSGYVTTAEARRKTQGEGADAKKVNFEYVYAPFKSIHDSTITVTDKELETYIAAHKNEFEVKDARNINYVALSYRASAEDRNELFQTAQRLKRELAVTEDDQTFVSLNAETQSKINLALYTTLPAQLKADSANLVKGKVYGPFFTNNKFETYKVSDIRFGEGISKTSISFISIDTSQVAPEKIQSTLDSAKAILATATSLDSATVASLGWTQTREIESADTISPKSIVDAAFASNEKGVYTSLVAYPQGVLILKRDTKVEEADNKYAIAKVDLELVPSQVTRDSVWDVASQLIGESNDLETFNAAVKANNTLRLDSAMQINKNGQNLGRYKGSDVESIIAWSYNNKVGTIATDIYELPEDEIYIIAAVSGATEKDNITVDAVRALVTTKVREEKKAALLIAMFDKYQGKPLKEVSTELNKENNPRFSSSNTVNNFTIGSTYISNFPYGYDAIMAGTAFGLAKDATSSTMIGDKGVFIVKVTTTTDAVAKKDYSNEKKAIAASIKFAQANKLNTAFEEIIEIDDTRYQRR
jgi:peptidyl-prolyl cis-trans isomerase D